MVTMFPWSSHQRKEDGDMVTHNVIVKVCRRLSKLDTMNLSRHQPTYLCFSFPEVRDQAWECSMPGAVLHYYCRFSRWK